MVYKLTVVQSNDDKHVPYSICVVFMVSLSVSSWYCSWFKFMVYKLTTVSTFWFLHLGGEAVENNKRKEEEEEEEKEKDKEMKESPPNDDDTVTGTTQSESSDESSSASESDDR